jgi:hypothetical protein
MGKGGLTWRGCAQSRLPILRDGDTLRLSLKKKGPGLAA